MSGHFKNGAWVNDGRCSVTFDKCGDVSINGESFDCSGFSLTVEPEYTEDYDKLVSQVTTIYGTIPSHIRFEKGRSITIMDELNRGTQP